MDTEIDPRGDVVLILRFPNSQVFSWPDGQKGGGKGKKGKNEKNRKKGKKGKNVLRESEAAAEPGLDRPASEPELEAQPEADPEFEPAGEPEPETQRVADPELESAAENIHEPAGSSAEPAEARPTSECWGETRSPAFSHEEPRESRRELLTSEWDTEALLVLLNIIHGRHRAVPKSVNLETLVSLQEHMVEGCQPGFRVRSGTVSAWESAATDRHRHARVSGQQSV
ncbi:hypothetical protein V500_02615 [Pseudogymnoascus sp. VKM F-4518 (FW-2643)]|nr:hypothetical protein V500_02615 [Pseudogymnoascus sp. VKM F-4518 (FW-2643)]